ncbi:hypothetical protein GYMLUDRAFT_72375 [Collybiopsis luxurians FD-317 M1]|uniref:XLF-like N-terminal domain-containing protein n=1 Tax=Collybiopsis luxurians FD-317 M1 TaxID=944289 RepID=A0A0D0BGT8_9AGAR|nr:hypothetical protein GYMLUDRAFT_72375 [Collybiopsis luxurians FD-317 M1]
MEELSQEQFNQLFSKEWLVKSDSENSVPYLFKFNSSTTELTCLIMITDTKSVWVEVLNSNKIARRWRACNRIEPFEPSSAEREETEKAWRLSVVENLTKIHTPGGMDIVSSFQVIESRYSDFAFEIEFEDFKWVWETNFIGHRNSAEIISKHLVLPLISFSQVSFISGSLGRITESELEKTIDTTVRNARRSIDTHVKNVVSKPLITTSVRRLTAMLNFADELPPISSMNVTPELTFTSPPHSKIRAATPSKPHAISPNRTKRESNLTETPPKPVPFTSASPRENPLKPIPVNDDDSCTEPSDVEPNKHAESAVPVVATPAPTSPSPPEPSKSKSLALAKPTSLRISVSDANSSSSPNNSLAKNRKVESSASDDDEEAERRRVTKRSTYTRPAAKNILHPSSSEEEEQTPAVGSYSKSTARQKTTESDADSSPARPPAKKKKVDSSSEDSEEERRKRVAKLKSGGPTGRGGVRQPLKRGGKRF